MNGGGAWPATAPAESTPSCPHGSVIASPMTGSGEASSTPRLPSVQSLLPLEYWIARFAGDDE